MHGPTHICRLTENITSLLVASPATSFSDDGSGARCAPSWSGRRTLLLWTVLSCKGRTSCRVTRRHPHPLSEKEARRSMLICASAAAVQELGRHPMGRPAICPPPRSVRDPHIPRCSSGRPALRHHGGDCRPVVADWLCSTACRDPRGAARWHSRLYGDRLPRDRVCISWCRTLSLENTGYVSAYVSAEGDPTLHTNGRDTCKLQTTGTLSQRLTADMELLAGRLAVHSLLRPERLRDGSPRILAPRFLFRT